MKQKRLHEAILSLLNHKKVYYSTWMPKFKKDRKRKTNVLHKNKKLPSVNLFSKLNIESEHINTVNRTKNTPIILFLSIPLPTMVVPWLDPQLGISLPMPKLELQISP